MLDPDSEGDASPTLKVTFQRLADQRSTNKPDWDWMWERMRLSDTIREYWRTLYEYSLHTCAFNAIKEVITKNSIWTLESQNWMLVDTRLHPSYFCVPRPVWKRNQEVWSSPQDAKEDSHMRWCKVASMIILHNFSSPPCSWWCWWRSPSTAFLMINGVWDATYSEATSSASLADSCSTFCNKKKEYSRTTTVAMRLLLVTFWTGD